MTELYSELPPPKEAALQAYLMAKDVYTNNEILAKGEEPTDSEGKPLYVSFVEDVPQYTKQCFGNTNEINDAILAAYEATHKA